MGYTFNMIRNIAMQFVVWVLRVIYLPFHMLQVKNRITFISRQDDKPSIDIKLLVDYISDHHPDIQCRILAKRLEGTGKVSYAFHMLSQMRALSTSRVVVLDGYCIVASALKHKKDTAIIQMWHALTAIKKFGYQILDKPSGRRSDVAKIMCMHRNYDYVLAASRETGKLFCQAFHAPEDCLRFFALPRVDEIIKEDHAFRAAVRREYDIPDEKEIVLYVPTFRKGRQIDAHKLAEMVSVEGHRLIVKLHPVFDDGYYAADRKYSSYQWMKVCDRVITDYSALGLEAILTGKPVYYYVHDIDAYQKEVGLNINPEIEMPSASARTIEELQDLLGKEYNYKEAARFREKYFSVPCGNCTETLAEFLCEMVMERKINGNA